MDFQTHLTKNLGFHKVPELTDMLLYRDIKRIGKGPLRRFYLYDSNKVMEIPIIAFTNYMLALKVGLEVGDFKWDCGYYLEGRPFPHATYPNARDRYLDWECKVTLTVESYASWSTVFGISLVPDGLRVNSGMRRFCFNIEKYVDTLLKKRRLRGYLGLPPDTYLGG